MEEKIYQILLEGLKGKTSPSERTIRSRASRIAKRFEKEEDITAEALADDVADLIDIAGQINHDIKEALDRQKPAPKKEKDTKQPQQEKEETPAPTQVDKTLMEDLKNLKEQFAALQQEREIRLEQEKRKNLFQGVKDALIQQGCIDNHFSNALELAMNGIDYTKDIETNVTALKQVYDRTMQKSVERSGLSPEYSMGVTFAPKTSEERRKQEEEWYKRAHESGKL